uniref:Uncharacterized protein n=1 Tax=uncultured marine virus TaxID=186617 RepID=A0A0F7L1N8_9VIRU|nr:hypothetical protein [uncultured marine virus]
MLSWTAAAQARARPGPRWRLRWKCSDAMVAKSLSSPAITRQLSLGVKTTSRTWR